MPTISICEEGYIMNKHQSDSLGMKAEHIHKDPILRSESFGINVTKSQSQDIHVPKEDMNDRFLF